jgi:hypothetical protein
LLLKLSRDFARPPSRNPILRKVFSLKGVYPEVRKSVVELMTSKSGNEESAMGWRALVSLLVGVNMQLPANADVNVRNGVAEADTDEKG